MSNVEKRRIWERTRQRNLKIRTFNYLGGCKCSNCGCEDLRVLELNHINGGGNKELNSLSTNDSHPDRKVSGKGWRNLYRSVYKDNRKDEFNVLCKVCNSAHYVHTKYGIDYDIRLKGLA